jgi:diketogulonate reductase-like aldo/keto reductase
VERVEENAAALDVVLSPEQLATLDALDAPQGERYPEASIPSWVSPPLAGTDGGQA